MTTNAWLARYAKLVAGATFLLIFVGGLVTSTGSGLSVPDWPTTYGYNMFTFPLSKWVGGIRYEHSHRLVASGVGFLTIGLCSFLIVADRRRWLKWLGGIALLAVILQGILGGLTVKYLLPLPISTAHACLAQAFFCIVVAIATFTSRRWNEEQAVPGAPGLARLHRLAIATAAIVYVQLILGAVMRHMEAGLAIPTFPLAPDGGLLPTFDSPGVAVHFAHRVGALFVAVHVVLLAVRVLRNHRGEGRLVRPAVLIAALLLLQIGLGAEVIWRGKPVTPTTLHVAVGAAILATAVTLALRTYRGKGLATHPDPLVPSGEREERDPVLARTATVGDYMELTKPRVTALVVVTALVGFLLGTKDGPTDWPLLVATLLGTALLASGSATLNQWLEREHDARMKRTARRPLPSGRLAPGSALAFGLGAVLTGMGVLIFGVNLLTAGLGLATVVSYVGIYTPLKRVTWLNTAIGAIPGALPPVMGWAGARNGVGVEAWALFAILFIWQLPHFFAIAWLYREDYARAGYAMLPAVDPRGERTARQIAAFSTALVPVSLVPAALGVSGPVYLWGALALGVTHLALGLAVSAYRTRPVARGLFLGSLFYLPALLVLMTADKL